MFQRFDSLTYTIRRRVRTFTFVRVRVFAGKRGSVSVRACLLAMRASVRESERMRVSACVCVCARLQVCLRARVVDTHACTRPCACRRLSVYMYAFFAGEQNAWL